MIYGIFCTKMHLVRIIPFLIIFYQKVRGKDLAANEEAIKSLIGNIETKIFKHSIGQNTTKTERKGNEAMKKFLMTLATKLNTDDKISALGRNMRTSEPVFGSRFGFAKRAYRKQFTAICHNFAWKFARFFATSVINANVANTITRLEFITLNNKLLWHCRSYTTPMPLLCHS